MRPRATASALAGSTHVCGPALSLRVDAVDGRARALTLQLPHGPLRTPVFMPVGTHGTVKGLTSLEMQGPPLDFDIILANTYHLGCRPGGETLAQQGGLHAFMEWPRNILTDSGGFQMVSLLKLANITEEGVEFASPVDGSRMLLTPEMSMTLQNQIGSDVMMALDDVVDSKTVDAARFEEACHRTLRWIDRCIAAHKRPAEQNLFGIVQGGLDVSPGGLRDVCLAGMLERDENLPGYAIGGLAGGEEKSRFWPVVDRCAAGLPVHKPRYLMGVGYPLDLVVCTALGVDAYDCVYPTRTARFGTALVHGGLLKVKSAAMADDPRPLDATCPCHVCASYSRATLHTLMRGDSLGPQLITYHNLAFMMRLTREMRAAIVEHRYAEYVRGFVHQLFAPPAPPDAPPPAAAVSAAAAAAAAAAGAAPETAGSKRQRDPSAAAAGAAAVAASGDASAADAEASLAAPGFPAIPRWVVEACAAAGIDVLTPPSAETAALFPKCPGAVPGTVAGNESA